MKPPRNVRLGVLVGLAGLALWVARASDSAEEATSTAGAARPRGTHPAHTAPAALTPSSAPTPTPGHTPRQTPRPGDEKPPAATRAAALAALDTALITRRTDAGATATNAFAPKSWFIAPPAPPPADEAPGPAPPPPQAPPLPFRYMGSMQESPERTVWYLMNGDRLVVAGSGDLIDATYRLDAAEGGQLRFTYLPLKQRQTLSIGAAP